ncbi:hypothetical protein [Shewanella waksmanii]|uniref:hypothetical protein n=1 Tax=Shewanella waksmanii TaxID=213783 RepID=UPI00048A710E|nr:hypothetical protein [Shewanella waksmanii]
MKLPEGVTLIDEKYQVTIPTGAGTKTRRYKSAIEAFTAKRCAEAKLQAKLSKRTCKVTGQFATSSS